MNFEKLTDNSWMPFGKYGKDSADPRKMINVPANYLLYLDGSTRQDVQEYIDNNRDVLESEVR